MFSLPAATRFTGPRPSQVRDRCQVDWPYLFDLPGRPPAQWAKRIDGRLAASLIRLPAAVTGSAMAATEPPWPSVTSSAARGRAAPGEALARRPSRPCTTPVSALVEAAERQRGGLHAKVEQGDLEGALGTWTPAGSLLLRPVRVDLGWLEGFAETLVLQWVR